MSLYRSEHILSSSIRAFELIASDSLEIEAENHTKNVYISKKKTQLLKL